MPMKNLHVLLVEDNEGDVLLTTEALRSGRIVKKLVLLEMVNRLSII